MKERLLENKKNREEAQQWFIDEDKRLISTEHDLRETEEIQSLSLNVLLTHYKNTFNTLPRTFLDVGCSGGDTFLKLRTQCNLHTIQLYGIDPSEHAITIAKKNVGDAKYHVIRAEELNESKALFPPIDAIFVHLCLGLWENPLKGITNLVELMSDKSIIYVADLHKNSITEGIKAAKNQEEVEYLKAQYKAALTEEELEYILREATSKGGDIHYTIGTGLFGGFNPSSMEFLRLINDADIQRIVRSLSKTKEKELAGKLGFKLQHGLIVKKR